MSIDPELSLLVPIGDVEESNSMVDLASIFGNAGPVEIEIGIGKGRFLIDTARRDSNSNFLGIEWAMKYLRIAHKRTLNANLSNIRFLRADAREFVEFFLPSNSVQAYHIYFPDPWPKKRHHKRRLINTEFRIEVERTLCAGGRVWLATDHQDYFEVMMEVFEDSLILEPVEVAWEGTRTNYEQKYMDEGKLIFRQVFSHK
jgi:tRNA (guanine-N7-)-methyltransferase